MRFSDVLDVLGVLFLGACVFTLLQQWPVPTAFGFTGIALLFLSWSIGRRR